MKDVPRPTDFSIMERISETAFKTCLAQILGDQTRKDWGGEMSDHYTTSLTMNSRRYSGAFLLKGPSRFAEMGLELPQ